MSAPLPAAFAAEREALMAVARCARAQLAALGAGEPEAFEAAAADTMDAVSVLDRCQQTRQRLAARPEAPLVADDLRASLEGAVAEAREACDALSFALEHTVALGRDLLATWGALRTPATAQVYTAQGQVGPPGVAARIHQTG